MHYEVRPSLRSNVLVLLSTRTYIFVLEPQSTDTKANNVHTQQGSKPS